MSSSTIFLTLALIAVFAWAFLRCKLWLSRAERSENKERKFGAAGDYVRVTVMYEGKPVKLLMTQHEMTIAKDRADRQPEEFENDPNL